ncbi:hypothetical protein AQUCO_01000046v1 [Aquilegia coerulea]|uniref:Elongation factor Ts, mitochondrial n=1 Tax=Aquilegia coerulea TaxID=218851 RepID=A0A2G5E834_AQUCA|nr:hypothetical protein AQUCO_01000046v1 [Aquilegia coerulea]
MNFSRAAKCNFQFLYNRLSTASVTQSGHGYATWACRVPCIADYKEVNASLASSSTARQMFMRSFSAEVSASEQMNLIKLLRERTSAPIKEVKSALVACNWDIETAQTALRKKGVALASKKSSRSATEGLLALAQNDNKAAVIELNCETDFVARNEIFQYLALSLAKIALSVESSAEQVSTPFSLASEYLEGLKVNLDHPKLSGEATVQSVITEVAAMVGENVKLRRGYTISKTSNGVISSYLHTSPQPGLGRLAGILTLEVEDENTPLDALARVGSELAMHIVAAKPLFISREDVSSEALESERDILKSQVRLQHFYTIIFSIQVLVGLV